MVALRAKVHALEIDTCPFTRAVRLPRLRAHWMKPELVVQVAFREWTKYDKLRHPRLIGNRAHKLAGTDGRVSGSTHGFVIGHITPEAQLGGPIALLRDGDQATIDAVGNRNDVVVSDAELAERRKTSQAPPYKHTRSVLHNHVKLVSPASLGCVTDEQVPDPYQRLAVLYIRAHDRTELDCIEDGGGYLKMADCLGRTLVSVVPTAVVLCLHGLACTGTIQDGGGAPPPGMGGPSGPGEVMGAGSIGLGVVRRLSGTEYNNTVRDLLFTTLTPATEFQGDVGEDGFDKASGPQTVGATHLEAYEAAAERLVETLFTAPAQLARIVTCDLAAGDACLRSTLATFLPRAWRRPVTTAEVDRLMALAATEAMAGGTPADQMKLALRGALTSVHFLYLIERDLAPTSLVPRRLNNYEIASRLSYFLWSGMPDDALFSAAASGQLQDDAGLAAQVTRMLADPKAAAMTNVFAAQWLELARLGNHQPDPMLFPGVTAALKQSMEQETQLFFQDVLQKGGGLRSLLAANDTFLDPALAQHYGLTAPAGPGFAKVSLTGSNRIGGLLGQAGILMPTSGLKATSAVKRGEWVLDNLLCAPAPPPPPEVAKEIMDNAAAIAQAAATQTARQFLAQHRAKAQCAVCHNLIDPPGLALENYDPVGRFRTTDKGMAIDPSGTFNGVAFKDARELTALLSNDPQFAQCLARKLFTFALGRAPAAQDTAHVARLASGNDDTIPVVISRLVTSTPFRARRGGEAVSP